MFQTMTQIGKTYNIDAKSVGKILFTLKIRDPQHPKQKGFPFDQAITHGVAKAFEGREGLLYYRYNIETIKEEFEKLLPQTVAKVPEDKHGQVPSSAQGDISLKLQLMLQTLNHTLETKELEHLYELKSHIADIYAILALQQSTSHTNK